MLEVKNVSILINTRYLIQSLSFTLNRGDKLAIIGEEGNGKSTLLKCLLGICDYATLTGTVNWSGTIGYLEQSICSEELNKKVFDFLFLDVSDYYDKVRNLFLYLEELKLNNSILEQFMYTLSGGEKVKIGILKLLLENYDILFLDEPTNDLDIETLKWLEEFIIKMDKPILYISHDEILLASTANRILHIEQIKHKTECKHTLLNVDYNTYIEIRTGVIQKQTQIAKSEKREYLKKQQKLKQIMQKVEYQQNTISRANPHGAKVLKKKMHTLKSQEKKMNQMERTEIPDIEEEIQFLLEEVTIPKNKVILNMHIPELKIENHVLSKNIYLEIRGGVHVCIIGKNGVGKTTLLKQIYKELIQRSDIKVGYMPQLYDVLLQDSMNVLDFIADIGNCTQARMYLGNMKFTKEEMTGKIGELSNGSKAKLLLTKFVLEKYNVLILDEPTRNVSPLSNPVIRNALKKFKGTIISVSHDRKFIEELADIVYRLDKKGLSKISK